MPVKNRFAEMAAEITEWRRGFHALPHLRNQFRTCGILAGLAPPAVPR